MSEKNKRQMLRKAILRVARSKFKNLGATRSTEFRYQNRVLGRIQGLSDPGQRKKYRDLYKDYLSNGTKSSREQIELDVYAKLNNKPEFDTKVHVPNTNFYFQYILSEHAQFRMDERGIKNQIVKDVIQRGLRQLHDAQGTSKENDILRGMRSSAFYRVDEGGRYKVGGRIGIMSKRPEVVDGVPSFVFQMWCHTVFFQTGKTDVNTSDVIDEIDCIDLLETNGSTHVSPMRMASFRNRKADMNPLTRRLREMLSPQHDEQAILNEIDEALTEHINTISLGLEDHEEHYLERRTENPPLVLNVGGLTFSVEATWSVFGGVASNIRGQVYEIDNPAQRYRNNCITSLTSGSKYQIR